VTNGIIWNGCGKEGGEGERECVCVCVYVCVCVRERERERPPERQKSSINRTIAKELRRV